MRKYAALLAVILAASPALASPAPASALRNFQKNFSGSDALSNPKMISSSRLELEAQDAFTEAKKDKRTEWLKNACSTWLTSLKAPTSEILVLWLGGGSLWSCNASQVAMLEEWDDSKVPFTGQEELGRWFGFAGGQWAFGKTSFVGLNASEGTTLLKNQYTLALTQVYNSASSTFALGVAGRYLRPINDKMGWNAGTEILYTFGSSVNTHFTFLALGGMNFYVPGGSIDVTAEVGTQSTWGIITGYTFFLDFK